MKDILLDTGDQFIDVDNNGRDYRPLHVVDGQHRKVSCELDLFLQGFPVLISVLPLGTTYAQAAQLFTELNVTLSRSSHCIKSSKARASSHTGRRRRTSATRTTQLPAASTPPAGNRRAFQLAMDLACEPTSPLYQRLQTMEL